MDDPTPPTSSTPPPSTPTPAPLPTPVSVPVSTPAPIIAAAPVKGYKGFAVTSWILFAVTCLIAMIPIVGLISWPMAFVVIPLILVFAIITLTRGGTGQGIILIILAVVVMPTFLLIVPILSTAILGVAGVAHDQKQEKEIMTNLNVIANAKSQWATQTSAAAGAAVTMAEITQYLPGKTVKAVVGESYDPQPVGQSPTATLPANTSLVGRKGGDVLTADSLTESAASSTTKSETETSPAASATPTPDEE